MIRGNKNLALALHALVVLASIVIIWYAVSSSLYNAFRNSTPSRIPPGAALETQRPPIDPQAKQAALPPAFQNESSAQNAAMAVVPAFDPPGQPPAPPGGTATTLSATDQKALLTHYLQQICGDRTPTLADWQALINRHVPDADKFLHIPMGNGGGGHFVMSMCLDQQGHLWVGTEDEGIWRYDDSKPGPDQWTQFTIKDGIGDDNGYAVACDKQGRVWAGHLNHGVSVYNGIKWQNYEVVGGLSRPDTLSGPLGERIFHITVAPHDGDVWMCTSAGLARYSVSKDAWSYFTRVEGLPSDQANSLAFDNDGTAYLATQCDGIAIAGPADNYGKWRVVTGPDQLPTTPTGYGLPTNLMNDILVAKDGTIYAATTAGLAWSIDKGASWRFVRGADYADKVIGRAGGPPQGWKPEAGAILSEDYSTALAEDVEGNIHIGHRATAGDILRPHASGLLAATTAQFVSSLLTIPKTTAMLRGGYGTGLAFDGDEGGKTLTLAPLPPVTALPALPAGQSGNDALQLLINRKVETSPTAAAPIAFIGEDWSTKGDWVGRYGRQYTNLCASNSPMDDIIALGMIGQQFSLEAMIGSHALAGDSKRNWLVGLKTNDPNSPWNPFVGARREGEWDDHGEAYAPTWEGPDLVINTMLPEGIYRLSLYFYDGNGHNHALQRLGRDFHIAAGPAPEGGAPFQPLASVRIQNFHGGVYKQFLLEGEKSYRFEIRRGTSLNAILNGIFIDRLAGPPGQFDNRPLGCMGDVRYDPPAAPSPAKLLPSLGKIASFWERPTDSDEIGEITNRLRPTRILAYRAAAGADSSNALLACWRWSIPLWAPADQKEWTDTMVRAWEDFLRVNPGLRERIAKRGT